MSEHPLINGRALVKFVKWSPYARNILYRQVFGGKQWDIATMFNLAAMTEAQLLKYRGLGHTTLWRIKKALEEHGLKLSTGSTEKSDTAALVDDILYQVNKPSAYEKALKDGVTRPRFLAVPDWASLARSEKYPNIYHMICKKCLSTTHPAGTAYCFWCKQDACSHDEVKMTTDGGFQCASCAKSLMFSDVRKRFTLKKADSPLMKKDKKSIDSSARGD